MPRIFHLSIIVIVLSALWGLTISVVNPSGQAVCDIVCGIASLFAVLSSVMIVRHQKAGLPVMTICTVAYLSIVLYGPEGRYYSFYVYLGAYLVMLLSFMAPTGQVELKKMREWFEIKRFRHILWLFIPALALIIVLPLVRNESPVPDWDGSCYTEEKQALHISLNSPDVTLADVERFEKNFIERDTSLVDRVKALRHLLAACLMPDIHSAEMLRNTIYIYYDDFSMDQKQILDWYLDQGVEIDDRWNRCHGVKSLTEFKNALQIKFQ